MQLTTRDRGLILRLLLGLLCPAALSAGAPPAPDAAAPPPRLEFVAPQMGTLFRLVLFGADPEAARAASAAAFARVAELNRLLSDYDPNSELMRLTRQPVGTAVAVSPELFGLLQHSQVLAAASDGAFDVTLGPVVRLWRDARRQRRLPAPAEHAAAMRAVGHAKLQLNAADRTVALLAPGMGLDLGGIAKGFAADEALAVLRRHGFAQAMVAASGDLALGDAPPGAPGWKVELAPFGQPAAEPIILVAANVGISTSGDSEQFVEIDGVRYSHIVDPATGLGLTTRVAVTIIAPNATRADSLATAGSVLVIHNREKLAECLGDSARALVFRRDESGRVQRESYGSSPPGLRPQP